MSLKRNKALLIVLSALILLVLAFALLFPGIIDSIITGFAPFDTFSVTLSATHMDININDRIQLDLVLVNGTNITIKAPVTYYGTIVMNLSSDIPSGFECGFDWYINESGVIKNISVSGTNLTWEANKVVNNTFLYFEVPPPTVLSEVTYTGDSYYEKTFTVDSCCALINVSINVSVNQNYTNYALYQIINSTLVNKTDDYNLVVSNGTAHFSGFNLSNKTFRLTAEPAPEVIQVIIHTGSTGGGGGITIPMIDYNTTKAFIVEPNYISIVTTMPAMYESIITIYNLRGGEKNFIINHTDNFIYDVESNVIIPHKEFLDIQVHMNASALQPGKYTDYIYITDGDDVEKVTVNLEMLEIGEEEVGEAGVMPEEQQPAPVSPEEGEPGSDLKYEKRFSLLVLILTLVAGLILVSATIYFHLKGKR